MPVSDKYPGKPKARDTVLPSFGQGGAGEGCCLSAHSTFATAPFDPLFPPSTEQKKHDGHTATARGASARCWSTAETSSGVLKNPKLKRIVPSPGHVPMVSCESGAQ